MKTEKRIPRERKRRLDSLFEAFSIIGEDTYVYLCDMMYDCSRWSKNLVDIFGLPSEYMYEAGAIWEDHIHPEDKKIYREGIDAIFSGKVKGHDMQYRARKKDGVYDVCTCRGIVITDEYGQPEYFGGAIRNHSEQSHIDNLTGLRNQYGFFEDVESCINNKTEIRICVVGIGRLTELNEVYGYGFGNAVLQRFGRFMMDHVGNRGGTYRLDGSKFAVITQTQSEKEVRKTYEELRRYFRKGIQIEDRFISLELNSGALALKEFNTDTQTIYTCLNFAYDESKVSRHGDLVEFEDNLAGRHMRNIETLHMIRNSITRGYEGFYLLYQPIIEAESGRITGAEALLRWKNDEYGVVPPDEFIPLLERDPKFPVLGEWILRKAIKTAKKMMSIMPDFVINVNISYAQLERPDFTDTVWNILNELEFPPEHLCLEITERCRLLDMDLLRNVVVTLRAGGVKMALDDFGTGFSSVGLVKNIPIDTIKIDRSFIQNIEEDEKEGCLVNSFTEVAVLFGANVCVEGIENAAMRDLLNKYDVKSFQGYFYSRPIEKDELLKMIKGSAK